MRFDKKDWKPLHEAISEAFWEHWDPIGVNDEPSARDEYDGYVFGFVAHLTAGSDEEKLTNYLWDCQRYNMGMESSPRSIAEAGARAALRAYQESKPES